MMLGGPVIVMRKLLAAICAGAPLVATVALSATVIVKSKIPCAVGVPLIVPDAGSTFKPGGNPLTDAM